MPEIPHGNHAGSTAQGWGEISALRAAPTRAPDGRSFAWDHG
jgi:hypothetical protein